MEAAAGDKALPEDAKAKTQGAPAALTVDPAPACSTPTASATAAPAQEENDDEALYRSEKVVLPPTVPELVRAYEEKYLRCEEMRALLDSLRVQANHFAETSPSAGAALVDLLDIVSEDDAGKRSPGGEKRRAQTPPQRALFTQSVTTPGTADKPQAGSSSTPVTSPPLAAAAKTVSQTPPSASDVRRPASATVSGTVVTGRVITAGKSGAAVAGTPSGPAPASASPGGEGTPASAADSGALGRLSRMVGDFKRDYKEECNVLRAQLMAMEAAQQLLAVAREQVHDLEKSARTKEESLLARTKEAEEAREDAARLRDVLDGKTGATEGAAATSEVALSKALAEATAAQAALRQLQTRMERVQYSDAQLKAQAAEKEKNVSFLNEKNTKLEGQLQRLLMASSQMGMSPPAAPLPVAAPPPPAAATRAAPVTPSTPATAQRQQPAPGTPAEAYNKAAMEKQVTELRQMVEKLQKRTEVNTEKRRRLDASVQELTAENNKLKADVLQYRRQVNESELGMEREVSMQADEGRTRGLEKELLRVRNAARERIEVFERKLQSLQTDLRAAQHENSVYRSATTHLQKALLSAQLHAVVRVQRTADHSDGNNAADEQNTAQTPTKDAESSTGHYHTHSPVSQRSPTKRPSPISVNGHASPTERGADSTTVSPVHSTTTSGPGTKSSPLQHNKDALEEMRQLYERRMETLEAHKRAEVKHVQNLNRELRHALAASQEEVQEKLRLLEVARSYTSSLGNGDSGYNFNVGARSAAIPVVPASGAPSAIATPLFPARSANNHFADRAGTLEAVSALGPRGQASGIGTPVRQSELLGVETLPAPASTTHSRFLSADSSGAAAGLRALSESPSPVGRSLVDIEQQYDPENQSVWEAVQVENEALLQRVSVLQVEKWAADTTVEDLQRQNGALEREMRRNADTMNQLVKAGVFSPAAMQKGKEEGRLRSLQCLLQETLTQKMSLEEEVSNLTAKLARYQ